MNSFKIFLDDIDKIKEFSNLINKFDGDFDLIADGYIIDARSIMSIFSLNLNKPLKLEVKNVPNIAELEILLKDFM